MAAMMQETVWFDKHRYDDAERLYQERLAGTVSTGQQGGQQSGQQGGQGSKHSELVDQIIQARQRIQNTLKSDSSSASGDAAMVGRIEHLEKVTQDLQAMVIKLTSRITALEGGQGAVTQAPAKPAPAAAADDDDDDDDDDIDLFGSDDEEESAAAAKLKEERIAAYAAKKAKKPELIAKSSVVIDVKPWDDETDLAELEKRVRSVEMDGLLWGASKLIPVGYGIKKVQIMCVVEDAKVSTEELEEKICDFEDFVQSTDIVAFNKI